MEDFVWKEGEVEIFVQEKSATEVTSEIEIGEFSPEVRVLIKELALECQHVLAREAYNQSKFESLNYLQLGLSRDRDFFSGEIRNLCKDSEAIETLKNELFSDEEGGNVVWSEKEQLAKAGIIRIVIKIDSIHIFVIKKNGPIDTFAQG